MLAPRDLIPRANQSDQSEMAGECEDKSAATIYRANHNRSVDFRERFSLVPHQRAPLLRGSSAELAQWRPLVGEVGAAVMESGCHDPLTRVGHGHVNNMFSILLDPAAVEPGSGQ